MHKKWQVIALSLISTTSAFANPTGAEVVQGQVAIATEGQTVQIQAADKSIIHWQDFSIQSGELTRFVQPDISSTVLNRVVGVNQSMINGVLEANGRVILVNPAGVIIGKEGVIRTADFIASTTDILNLSDWSIRTDGASASQIDSTNCSALINHEGLIQATGVDRSGGRVLLMASHVAVDGQVQTDGGRIELLGEKVQVGSNAILDASSMNGGGTILVGGDYQGSNPDIQNSREVLVVSGAQFSADALQNGDGGRVIFWSDERTVFEGQASAKGGQIAGDGGFVEISSPQLLRFHGLVNTTAPMGKTGTLLLDPCDIVISSTPGSLPTFIYNTPLSVYPDSSFLSTPADLYSIDVQTTLQTTLNTSNVEITTANGSGGTGNITWNAGAPINWMNSNSLLLKADNNIFLNSDITCTTSSGTGPISLSAGGSINIGSTSATTSTNISTFGPITLQAGTGVTIEGGMMTGADATVVTSIVTAPLSVTTTTGDVTVESVTGNCQAAIGGANSGAITINIPAGDLILNSNNLGYVLISSEDYLDLTTNNITVSAQGAFPTTNNNVYINVDSSTNNPSTLTINDNWTSNATPILSTDLPVYAYSFQDSFLNLIIDGDLNLQNSANAESGFTRIGDGGMMNITGDALVQTDSATGQTYIGSNTNLAMTVGGKLTIQNIGTGGTAAIIGQTTLSANVGGGILIQGLGSAHVAYFGLFTGSSGPLTLTSQMDISLDNGGAILPPQNGPATVIANGSLIMSNGSAITAMGTPGANCELTIVVDNQFPNAPSIGTGAFSMDATSDIFPKESVPVQIFTARQSLNTIAGTINDVTFTPGAFDVNTATEQWSTYYPSSFFGGPPDNYTIFYKEPQSIVPPPPPPGGGVLPSNFTLTALAAPQLAEIIGNMFDTIDEFEYPLSYYRDAFCVKWQDGQQLQKGARQFNNDSCYWVQVENYRKYYPYREKHRID